jgi:membrane associated rhomboid family serine protease
MVYAVTMLIPIRDDNPLRLIRFQVVTATLIALNFAIFILTGPVAGEQGLMAIATGFGLVPQELLHATAASNYQPVPESLTVITYAFLHGSWMHVISNMLILWILGDNVEDAFGHFGFIVFYLLCAAAAGLTHAFMSPASPVPLVGASGAIAGVMGGYLLLYPKARITSLLGMIFPIRLPAYIFLMGWLILQFVSLRAPVAEGGQVVAWWAHIGGFAAGVILTFLWPNRRALMQSP